MGVTYARFAMHEPPGALTCTICRVVPASVACIYRAFVDGTVFALTGASTVSSDARVDGAFQLVFEGRGTVSGRFLDLLENEGLRLAWNVSGFGRPDETTIVEMTISSSYPGSAVSVRHRNIGSPESAEAKTRAWEAILSGL